MCSWAVVMSQIGESSKAGGSSGEKRGPTSSESSPTNRRSSAAESAVAS